VLRVAGYGFMGIVHRASGIEWGDLKPEYLPSVFWCLVAGYGLRVTKCGLYGARAEPGACICEADAL